jgi:glutathionyl-hydroquinone reductase
MGRLSHGEWVRGETQPSNEHGEFVRADSSFREWVRADGSTRFAPEVGRYHLYVAHACPWAHRTLIARALLGLEDAISISIVHPLMLEEGWVFGDEPGLIGDPILHARALHELYVAAKPDVSGKATVPVLWDRQHQTIVNNESREIVRMFSSEFAALSADGRELAPAALREPIDAVIDRIYAPINNGVYRCGFATSQEAYDRAVRELFDELDHWEGVLSRRRFTCGDQLTEADIFLFTTLFRFDLVYATHFKCNLRRLVDYPQLFGFVRDVYQTQGVAGTCDVARIKQHYYGSHGFINPQRIVPIGFEIDFAAPHGRARLTT